MENNYKTCITPAKEDAVKVLREEFSKYNGFIFTEYRGMTVSQMTALRTQLRENDAQYKVVKNRFAKLALCSSALHHSTCAPPSHENETRGCPR